MPSATRRFYLAVFALLGASHSAGTAAARDHDVDHIRCAIDPGAIVSDACASYSTLDSLNQQIHPALHELTQDTDFFSYYRLNLYNKVCPFWSDESGMCGNIACAVNTIDNEDDIPAIWRAEELGKLEGPKAQHPSRNLQRESRPLMGGLGDDVGESCVVEYDDECDERDYCVPEDESATAKGDYVSLVDNPERFTGYSGPAAHQVWEAIYRENCFTREPAAADSSQHRAARDLGSVMKERSRQAGLVPRAADEALELGDECLEKRVFYRVISGMHASISTHLCWDYLNQTTGTWGPNLACYEQRLHNHADRMSNLYFNYALVLRAVAKARPALADYTFCSGDAAQDAATKRRVLALADRIAAGPRIYDESAMFAGAREAALKADFRARFRNVSRTMDCVGCDKCRLWGKLQTAGYGTALKILFEFDEAAPAANPPLRRTELVALVNTLDKLAHSLSALTAFERMLQEQSPQASIADVDADAGVTPHGDNLPANTNVPPDDTFGDASDDAPDDTWDGAWDDPTAPDPRLQPGTADLVAAEFRHVWRTLMWILRRWTELPGDLVRRAVFEAARAWHFWLGLPGLEVRWEAHAPPSRDEI